MTLTQFKEELETAMRRKADRYARQARHYVRGVIRYQRHVLNYQEGMRAVPLGTTLTKQLQYWWHMKTYRGTQAKRAGSRVRQLRNPELVTKAWAVVQELERAGITMDTYEEGHIGTDTSKGVRVLWDVHAKGLAVRARYRYKNIAEATYYTRLLFKNKTLDVVLG